MLRCGSARNPELSKVARMPVIQLLNQGLSALPLSRGVGCPARLPSPEDSWSGSAGSWESRVGRSCFWIREPRKLNYPLPSGQVQGPCSGRWGPPLRVQGGQEGCFSSLPSLLGRARWHLYGKLPSQSTEFSSWLLGGTGWGSKSSTRVLLSSSKKSTYRLSFFA